MTQQLSADDLLKLATTLHTCVSAEIAVIPSVLPSSALSQTETAGPSRERTSGQGKSAGDTQELAESDDNNDTHTEPHRAFVICDCCNARHAQVHAKRVCGLVSYTADCRWAPPTSDMMTFIRLFFLICATASDTQSMYLD
jgi:hypothetical protein